MPGGETWSQVQEFDQSEPDCVSIYDQGRTYKAQGLSEYGSISTVGSTQLKRQQRIS